MVQRWVAATAAVLLFLSVSPRVEASILGTSVSTSMRITQNLPFDETLSSDSGLTGAQVSLLGAAGSSASSNLQLSGIGAETATLDFNIAMFGGRILSGYMGRDSTLMRALITYQAVTDTTLHYAWDFEYSGPEPFGLQRVQLLQDDTEFANLGDDGIVGSHAGSDSLLLAGGSTYVMAIDFDPNVSGGLSIIDGQLAGFVTFDFQPSASAVPEPASLGTFAGVLGIASIGWLRRRRRLNRTA